MARCTSVSAQSHIISLIASFGSIRSKCWRMLRNGISCGVSATYTNVTSNEWQHNNTREIRNSRKLLANTHTRSILNWPTLCAWCVTKTCLNSLHFTSFRLVHDLHIPVLKWCKTHPNVNSIRYRSDPEGSVPRHIHVAHRKRPIEQQHLDCGRKHACFDASKNKTNESVIL